MSDDNPTEQAALAFQGWTPFAVTFRADGSVASLVGPDEGDPYSLLGTGDVWSYNAGDETDGDWITNVDLSIESAIIAGRAADRPPGTGPYRFEGAGGSGSVA